MYLGFCHHHHQETKSHERKEKKMSKKKNNHKQEQLSCLKLRKKCVLYSSSSFLVMVSNESGVTRAPHVYSLTDLFSHIFLPVSFCLLDGMAWNISFLPSIFSSVAFIFSWVCVESGSLVFKGSKDERQSLKAEAKTCLRQWKIFLFLVFSSRYYFFFLKHFSRANVLVFNLDRMHLLKGISSSVTKKGMRGGNIRFHCGILYSLVYKNEKMFSFVILSFPRLLLLWQYFTRWWWWWWWVTTKWKVRLHALFCSYLVSLSWSAPIPSYYLSVGIAT